MHGGLLIVICFFSGDVDVILYSDCLVNVFLRARTSIKWLCNQCSYTGIPSMGRTHFTIKRTPGVGHC